MNDIVSHEFHLLYCFLRSTLFEVLTRQRLCSRWRMRVVLLHCLEGKLSSAYETQFFLHWSLFTCLGDQLENYVPFMQVLELFVFHSLPPDLIAPYYKCTSQWPVWLNQCTFATSLHSSELSPPLADHLSRCPITLYLTIQIWPRLFSND